MFSADQAEAILAGPDRVHCIPYAANLSRKACLKQQEMARRRRQAWWGHCGSLESREPCLRCQIGKELKEKKPDLGRPQHCRFHPDRPRHRDLLVCLPCYRVLRRRLNKAREGLTMSSPRVKKIYRETILELERQMGLTPKLKETNG